MRVIIKSTRISSNLDISDRIGDAQNHTILSILTLVSCSQNQQYSYRGSTHHNSIVMPWTYSIAMGCIGGYMIVI